MISSTWLRKSRFGYSAAIGSLESLGALERAASSLKLTPLGYHLARIPAPPRIGKLLVMGSLLGCRNVALSVAAGISTGRTPFQRISGALKKPSDRDVQDQRILEERQSIIDSVGNSDHLLIAVLFSSVAVSLQPRAQPRH